MHFVSSEKQTNLVGIDSYLIYKRVSIWDIPQNDTA